MLDRFQQMKGTGDGVMEQRIKDLSNHEEA